MMLSLLAWLFIHPLSLPAGARLWMLLPLVACVAAVYRVTRARDTRGLLRPTIVTGLTIVVGMALIAVGFYLLHVLVRRYF